MSAINSQFNSFWLTLMVLALPLNLPAAEIQTNRVVLSASKAFEDGQGVHGVMLDASGNAVLYNRVLIEDDGPGQGSDADWLRTDRVATQEISGQTVVKKILHIDRLNAMDARLIVPPRVGIEINGHTVAPWN